MKFFVLILLTGLLSHCADGFESRRISSIEDQDGKKNLISIGIHVYSQNLGIIANSVPFVLTIDQCGSGFAKFHDSALDGAELRLFDRDTGCIAGLVEFSWQGRSWTPVLGSYFHGTQLGIFENSTDQETLGVVNPFRLSNPIHKDDHVGFVFTELKAGSSLQLFKINGPYELFGGPDESLASPALSIPTGGLELAGIDYLTNQAQLNFELICAENLDAGTCKGQDLMNMDVLLVQRYSQEIDHSLASDLFDNPPGASQVISIEANHIIEPSESTTGGLQFQISSPEAFTACRSFHFIIRYRDNDSSFTYFELDLLSRQETCSP